MNVEAVVFDIGNVLLEWNPERFYDQRYGPDWRRAMFAAVDLHDMNERIDQGANFRDLIYATADAHPEWRTEIRDWHDCWGQLARPAIPHSVKLMQALRASDIPVFALTNFGVDSFTLATTLYPFLTEFDQTYVSGRLGVIKPDARIYEIVEDQCGVRPDRLLFTDDRADNIAAAKARGWQGHLFDGPQGWADRLVAEGLLNGTEAAP